MKPIHRIFIFSALLIALFSACNDDTLPNESARKTFENMYPNAQRVEWEFEHGYYNVDFRHEGYEKEAWFSSSGEWIMTKTEFGRNIPAIIADALNKTEYKNWKVDDVDYIEQREKEPFYIVEVEKGEIERYLWFSAAGELLEERNEKNSYPPLF